MKNSSRTVIQNIKIEEKKVRNETFDNSKSSKPNSLIAVKSKQGSQNYNQQKEAELDKIEEVKENKGVNNRFTTKRRTIKARIVQTAEPFKPRYNSKFVQFKRKLDKIDLENELKLQNKRRIAMEYDKIKISKYFIISANKSAYRKCV